MAFVILYLINGIMECGGLFKSKIYQRPLLRLVIYLIQKLQLRDSKLTFLKSGLNFDSAFGVAITRNSGTFSDNGFNVFKWQ